MKHNMVFQCDEKIQKWHWIKTKIFELSTNFGKNCMALQNNDD